MKRVSVPRSPLGWFLLAPLLLFGCGEPSPEDAVSAAPPAAATPLVVSGGAAARDPLVWGRELFEGMAQCASCHGMEGAGVAGSFPPLAGSPWVTGDPNRLIKVTLHGVAGQMEVLGGTYSNEMAGLGALLDDEQAAATLSYIRQAWGNQAAPVYADQVARVRGRFAERKEPWPAELLAVGKRSSPLKNLRYRKFAFPEGLKRLDDPRVTEAAVIGEGAIKDGFISLKATRPESEKKKPLLVAFEADLEVAAEEAYVFAVDTTEATVLSIDGEAVVERAKLGRRQDQDIVEVALSPGVHTLRLLLGTHGASPQLALSAVAGGVNPGQWMLTPGRTKALDNADPALLLVPSLNEPIVYRGRFENQGSQGVAVGHPLRVNYTFDTDRAQLTRVWRGEFLNASGHWVGRNEDFLPPAGRDVLNLATRPPLARRDAADAAWPAAPELNLAPDGYHYLGYELRDGVPVFYTRIRDAVLRDSIVPVEDTAGGGPFWRRTLTVYAVEADPARHALLAEGGTLTPAGDGVFDVDGDYDVKVVGADGSIPVSEIVSGDAGQQLIAPSSWGAAASELPAWVRRTAPDGAPGAGVQTEWVVEYRWKP